MSYQSERNRFNNSLKLFNIKNQQRKTSQLKLSCHLMRQQIKQLRQMQKDIMRWIKNIILFVPQEIQHILYRLMSFSHNKKQAKHTSKETKRNHEDKILKKQFTPLVKDQFHLSLKQEDTIKQSIFKELQTIKLLQNKENNLRITNQKHQRMRKSLSKQSLTENSISKRYRNNLFENKADIKDNRQPLFNDYPFFKTEESHTNSLQNSPQFGKQKSLNSIKKKHNYSRQKIQIRDEQYQTTTTLICENGHQYYQGQIHNRIPNGFGNLKNCCNKIPLKLSSKTVQYTGRFIQGLFEGRGTLICKGNIRFEGYFSKGFRHGQGIIYLQGIGEKGLWQNDKLLTFL